MSLNMRSCPILDRFENNHPVSTELHSANLFNIALTPLWDPGHTTLRPPNCHHTSTTDYIWRNKELRPGPFRIHCHNTCYNIFSLIFSYVMNEYRTSLTPVTRQDKVKRFNSPIHLMMYLPTGSTGIPDPRAMLLPIPRQTKFLKFELLGKGGKKRAGS